MNGLTRFVRWATRADARESARRRRIRSEAGRKSSETRRRKAVELIPDGPSEPVECPMDDPSCEGADGECHDACERPDAADMRLEADDARDAMDASLRETQ